MLRKILWGLLLTWAFLIYQDSFGRGFRWSEMDWNHDGVTMPWEIIHTVNYFLEVRDYKTKNCRTIVRMKDGMPQSEVCTKKELG